jgi:hypothetical protein
MMKTFKVLGTMVFIITTFFLFLTPVSAFNWENETLLAYFRFDEGTGDIYNNTQDTANVFTSDTTATWNVPGFIGNDTYFEADQTPPPFTGADGYTAPAAGGTYSWSIWFNWSGTGTEDQRLIYWEAAAGNHRLVSFRGNVAATSPGEIFFTQGAITVGGGGGTTVVNDSQWHHLVAQWDSTSQNARMYIDGNFISGATGVAAGTMTTTAALAKNAQTDSQQFNGTMDEFGWWNRTLSYAEVLELYNDGVGIPFLGEGSANFQGIESVETEILTLGDTINVSGSSVSSARLFYDDAFLSNPVTVTDSGGGIYTLNATSFDTPLLSEYTANITNRDWYFEATLANGTVTNASINKNLVSALFMDFCGLQGLTTPYINFTFKNETTAEEDVEASLTSSWTYYSGSGSLTKSFTYSDASENPSYGFCANLNTFTGTQEIFALPSITYDNAESQPRGYAPGVLTLSDTVTDQTLYLLPTSLGLFATIQVVNAAGSSLSDVTITVTHPTIGDVETRQTSDSGTATFFLDPFITYTITFVRDGYQTLVVTNMFSTTEFTATMVLAGETSVIFNDGISYTFLPVQNVLNNDTDYIFEWALSSSLSNLESYTMTLTDNSSNVIGTISGSTAAGSTLSLTNNTNGFSSVTLTGTFVINSTTNTVSRVYIIRDSGVLTQWSISNFFSHLSTYLSGGIFGLTSFGLGMIIFLIIFIATGVLSFRFGLNSPIAIASIVFALVLFFDVGLGLFPNPVNAVSNFPSIIIGIITIAIIFREVFK